MKPRYTVVFLIMITPAIWAGGPCHGHFMNPITDVCWRCLLPISIGSATVYSGDQPDTSNPESPVCSCPGHPVPRIGINMGYWEPTALVDVTRHPFCMVNLGGWSMDMGHFYGEGKADTSEPGERRGFYYSHWYRLPLLAWLNILTDGVCHQKGTLDIGYLSELDPSWRDDEVNFLMNPEAALFGNPVAQSACLADATKAMAHTGLDSLFWCLGSQGSAYPLTGSIGADLGGVQASTLIAERTAYKLHRLGMLWDSVSPKGIQTCSMYPMPVLPKSRYRYQMVNPVATTQKGGCQPFGRTTALWGTGHSYPVKGEDFGYLIWRKRNCCAF